MRCRADWLLVVAACVLPNHAPPSTLVHWLGEDDSHWSYDLSIDGDRFTQLIHQAGGTTCTQVGTIEQDKTELRRTFEHNDCNREYDGKTVHDVLISRDAKHLVVRMEGNYVIRYDRVP